MKKKPASTPEPTKTSGAKSRRPGKTEAVAAAPATAEKPKRAPRKPLLDAAVDAAKKMFKPKSAAARKKLKAEPQIEGEAPTVVGPMHDDYLPA